MISNQDFKDKEEVIIVGGGISGLLMAFFAVRSGKRVKLFEKSNRLGGMIQTRQVASGLVEEAAHSLLIGPALSEVIETCNVECDSLDRSARSRFVIRSDKMRRWPLSFFETIGMFLRAYFVLSSKEKNLVTVDGWARRHLGRAAANYLLTPFCRGIYGTDASNLCRQTVFKNLTIPKGHSLLSWVITTGLKKMGQRERTKKKAPKHVVPRYGMGDLVLKMEDYLRKQDLVEIHLNSKKIESDFLNLPMSSGLIYCGSPNGATPFFNSDRNQEIGKLLSQVEFSSLITCTAFVTSKFDLQELKNKFNGIGALASNETSIRPIGILFNSSAFKSRRKVGIHKNDDEVVSFTFIFRFDPDLVNLCVEGSGERLKGNDQESGYGESYLLNTDAIIKEIKFAFDTLAGKTISEHLEISIEGKAWRNAIPIYSIKHAELLKQLNIKFGGSCQTPNALALFGNYSGEVSIRGMAESAKESFSSKAF